MPDLQQGEKQMSLSLELISNKIKIKLQWNLLWPFSSCLRNMKIFVEI